MLIFTWFPFSLMLFCILQYYREFHGVQIPQQLQPLQSRAGVTILAEYVDENEVVSQLNESMKLLKRQSYNTLIISQRKEEIDLFISHNHLKERTNEFSDARTTVNNLVQKIVSSFSYLCFFLLNLFPDQASRDRWCWVCPLWSTATGRNWIQSNAYHPREVSFLSILFLDLFVVSVCNTLARLCNMNWKLLRRVFCIWGSWFWTTKRVFFNSYVLSFRPTKNNRMLLFMFLSMLPSWYTSLLLFLLCLF